jgi:hypothetical protein
MKKIKVLGIGNKEEFNWIIVKKDKDFFEWLNKVLTESFGSISPDIDFYDQITVKDKVVTRKKKIEDYTDLHEYYDAEGNTRMGLFYGKEKVFMTVFTSLKNRKKLMENLEKFSEFEE